MGGNVTLQEQIEKMKDELTESNLRASKVTPNEEEVDLERDEN